MIEKLKKQIRNYFAFSRAETNGFIVLSFIMILLIFVPSLIKTLTSKTYSNHDKDQILLDSLIGQIEDNKVPAFTKPDSMDRALSLTLFNPNTATIDELKALGLKENVAKRIINYRKKGGVFRIKSDLSKIYGLPEDSYLKLYHYIDLPVSLSANRETIYPKRNKSEAVVVTNKKLLDINRADSTQLKAIYGIGSVLAKRIIKFREKLGGFVSKDQYKEVWGLEEKVIETLNKETVIDPNFIPVQININNIDAETLKKHPYFYRIAKVIITYRTQHGLFTQLEDLKKIHLVDETTFTKIAPYLKVTD